MKLDEQVYLLGIRHHGPGCTIALQRALEEIQPDVVLIEGAEELESCWQLAGDFSIRPPVAQLVYDPKQPLLCAYYPWAEFSPEWQAMRYAFAHNTPVQMIDLPAGIEFELQEQWSSQQPATSVDVAVNDDGGNEADNEADYQEAADGAPLLHDPLDRVLHAAGYTDGEAWWDITIEHARNGLDVFAAIAELMRTAREADEADRRPPSAAPAGIDAESFPEHWRPSRREQLREAWMRKCLQQARKSFSKIAVVCGAWHVPALAASIKAKDDNALLKGLKRRKVEVAWVPYTYQRFSIASGYRAGIGSPGWYEHLYRHHAQHSSAEDFTIHWMINIASLLRKEGFNCSSAHVIDAVRLATQLARLRQLSLPSLAETLEAAQAVMTEGSPAPLQAIHQQLVVSNRLGELPADIPMLPLEQDLNAQIKALRLKKDVNAQMLALDLRKDSGLERSQLLHRLTLLRLPWGSLAGSGGLGTFREEWILEWKPEFAVAIIDASTLGNTIEAAATSAITTTVQSSQSVTELARALDAIQLGGLTRAIGPTIDRLKSLAAVSGDIQDLMLSLLTLVRLSRYGSVREINADGLNALIDCLVVRITNGLAPSCIGLDEAAAYNMIQAIDQCHSAITMLEDSSYRLRWQSALFAVIDQRNAHAVLLGRCTRILYDAEQLASDELEKIFRLAISQGNDVISAATWIEGFFLNGAVLLLFDSKLFSLLDHWLNGIDADGFVRILPLLRRAFSTFSGSELQQLGERVLYGNTRTATSLGANDATLAASALAHLAPLLGFTPGVHDD